jgi:hypothetical protein
MVSGPWPAVEARILADMIHLGVYYCERPTSGHFGGPLWEGTPGEVTWFSGGGSWARVRVSVEVLDGVL